MRSPDGRTPLAALVDIHAGVAELTAAPIAAVARRLVPALHEQGILVGGIDQSPTTS